MWSRNEYCQEMTRLARREKKLDKTYRRQAAQVKASGGSRDDIDPANELSTEAYEIENDRMLCRSRYLIVEASRRFIPVPERTVAGENWEPAADASGRWHLTKSAMHTLRLEVDKDRKEQSERIRG